MAQQKKGKEALLLWCQKSTEGYNGVSVKNFHTSWQDGLAFCALIHHFRPELINFNELHPEKRAENLTLAFSVTIFKHLLSSLDSGTSSLSLFCFQPRFMGSRLQKILESLCLMLRIFWIYQNWNFFGISISIYL